jgi:hypothetical protein
MLPLVAGAALSIGSSLFGSRSAKKAAAAAERQARERQAAEQQYGRDALGRSQALAGSMPTNSFKPWNIKTGLGSWEIDQATGQATAMMDPRAQGYQNWNYDQSEQARQQLGNFDRQRFAQQEFNRGQGLLSEGRNASLDGLLSSLQRKGLAGFGQTAQGGSSTSQTNPLLASLFDRQNRQDLELMDRSFGAADTQMDRLQNRATGLFDRGYAMNDDLNGQLQTSMQLGQNDYARGWDEWNQRARFGQGQEDYYRQAALGGMQGVADAQNMGTQARLSRDQGFARMGQNIGQSMFGGFQGMFQQPPTAQPYNGTMWGGW